MKMFFLGRARARMEPLGQQTSELFTQRRDSARLLYLHERGLLRTYEVPYLTVRINIYQFKMCQIGDDAIRRD